MRCDQAAAVARGGVDQTLQDTVIPPAWLDRWKPCQSALDIRL